MALKHIFLNTTAKQRAIVTLFHEYHFVIISQYEVTLLDVNKSQKVCLCFL